MRSISLLGLALAFGCGGNNQDGDGDGGNQGPDACVGIECNVVNCGAMSLPPTTITGKVFAPNGTLPLNGVDVYIPRDTPLPPFAEGVSCDRCTPDLPGSPVRHVQSDAHGDFRLENVPAGVDFSLVVTTGKWRRVVNISSVPQCTETPVAAADTRLPRNKAEGDLPKIAITTGNADTMECLARKLGIADSEITPGNGDGRINLYAGNGTNALKSGFAGGSGQSLSGAEAFWSSPTELAKYDIVILSCEGAQLNGATNKSQAAVDAVKGYADIGGRVFASHWHNIWISGKFQGGVGAPTPQDWNTVAQWQDGGNFDGNVTIDEINNPKGTVFADWMADPLVGGSPTRGQFDVNEGRTTATNIDIARAERWAVRNDAPQMFQFTTPINIDINERCGKVVFTDMHVSGTGGNGSYPDNCVGGENNLTLTAQEKALAFMFFDIASCVGGIF